MGPIQSHRLFVEEGKWVGKGMYNSSLDEHCELVMRFSCNNDNGNRTVNVQKVFFQGDNIIEDTNNIHWVLEQNSLSGKEIKWHADLCAEHIDGVFSFTTNAITSTWKSQNLEGEGCETFSKIDDQNYDLTGTLKESGNTYSWELVLSEQSTFL